jgi:alpha-glucosidase
VGRTSSPGRLSGGDYERINVAIERTDDGSLLRYVKRLLDLRRDTPALTVGRYTRIHPVPDECLAYVREHGDQRIAVALNFGDTPATVDLSLGGTAGGTRVLVHTGDRPVITGERLGLDAGGGAVLAQ